MDPATVAGSRACLLDVSHRSIMLCMVAFKVYHAIKQDYRADIDMAIAQGHFSDVLHRVFEIILHLIRQFNLHEVAKQAVVPSDLPATSDM